MKKTLTAFCYCRYVGPSSASPDEAIHNVQWRIDFLNVKLRWWFRRCTFLACN